MGKTDFEKDLIWNTDRTACFLPEEFSNARIRQIDEDFFILNVCLKNKQMIRFPSWATHFSTEEEIKELMDKLMSEIGEKRDRWKYKQARSQKG